MVAHRTGMFRLKIQIINPIIVVISFAITLYPFTGLSLAEYLLSINPNYSIGSIALLFVFLWKEFGKKQLLSDRDILWFSIYNIVVSLCLFASSLGFVRFDLYHQGYSFSVWFVITASLTIILFLVRNPLSYIFVAYIVAFDLKLLPSDNFFDYITDGILFFTSLGLAVYYTKKIIMKSKSRRL